MSIDCTYTYDVSIDCVLEPIEASVYLLYEVEILLYYTAKCSYVSCNACVWQCLHWEDTHSQDHPRNTAGLFASSPCPADE